LTHRIEREVVGEDRAAFNWECKYSDGMKVLAATTLELLDGKIVYQVNVKVWEEKQATREAS
jgi:hypothetical protein